VISGIITSHKMASKLWPARRCASASWALLAVVTSCWVSRRRRTLRSTSGSSSMIRTRPRATVTSGFVGRGTLAPVRRAMGKPTAKVLPWPGALVTEMRPPCSCTIIRDSVRPMPVPSAGSLVVKKGSKTRLLTSSGIPRPVSEISTTTSSPRW
jgi:hypothetical protein